MRGAAFLLIMLAVLPAARAHAEQTRVAVSWSGVRDAEVERCGLSRLRAGTIERLVGAGYAVVERVERVERVEGAEGSGVQVTVASTDNALRVHVQDGALSRDAQLDATGCDATFVLDVISRITELVDEVVRAAPPPAATGSLRASAEPAPAEPRSPASEPLAANDTQRDPLQAELDFTARANPSPDYQLGGGLGLRLRLPAGWESGARAELTAHAARGVTVLEAFLGVSGAYQPSLPGLAPYLELGPVLHHAASDARSVTRLDALLAAGVQLSLGHLLAQLLVYGRLRSIAHRVGTDTAFDTGRFGLVLRLGAQLSGA